MLKKNDIRCISHFKNHAVPVMKRQELTITREAIKILMLSPIYFLLTVPQRLVLVREYCQ
jgi:hypothetical protein